MVIALIGAKIPAALESEISELKQQVIGKCGFQQQVNEPPHLTFYLGDFPSLSQLRTAIKAAAIEAKPLNVGVNGIGYFPPEQTGMYIIHAIIQKTKMLEQLQMNILEHASPLNSGCKLCEYLEANMPASRLTPEEEANARRFGFPYAGKNWQPHITIAILDRPCFQKLGRGLLQSKITRRFLLDSIAIFSYARKWAPCCEIKLGRSVNEPNL